MFDLINGVFGVGLKLIDKFFPDQTEADKARLELLKLHASGELSRLTAETDLAKGQIQVNAIEAGNANLFVSGWRPAVGWICVLGLALNFFSPLISMISGKQLMTFDTSTLIMILGGMLGLGTLRTVEKINGVSS